LELEQALLNGEQETELTELEREQEELIRLRRQQVELIESSAEEKLKVNNFVPLAIFLWHWRVS
jgi:hypothetical protein